MAVFCCALLCVHYSYAIILMEKRELIVCLSLSSWYLAIVVWLFLLVLRVCLQFVIEVFPDHTHVLFIINMINNNINPNASYIILEFAIKTHLRHIL